MLKQLIVNFSRILVISLSLLISVSTFATELTVGMQAPNFNLQATNGDFYQLSDYQGKQAIVVAWYPMANTRGCTFECKSLTEDGHLIRKYDVSYFMVSVDPIDNNRDFAKKTGADFPMLSDPTKEAAKAYDVLNFFRVASRVTFYISIDGKILHIDEDVTPKSAAQDIAAKLGELNVAKFTPSKSH